MQEARDSTERVTGDRQWCYWDEKGSFLKSRGSVDKEIERCRQKEKNYKQTGCGWLAEGRWRCGERQGQKGQQEHAFLEELDASWELWHQEA